MLTTSPISATWPAKLGSESFRGSDCNRRCISGSPSRRASRSFWTTAKCSSSFSRRKSVPASARVKRRASVRIRCSSVARSRSLVRAMPICTRSRNASVRLIASDMVSVAVIPNAGPPWARTVPSDSLEPAIRVPRSLSGASSLFSLGINALRPCLLPRHETTCLDFDRLSTLVNFWPIIALDFTGDDTMLFRMVEAYAWTLEYPESVRRLMPGGDSAGGWPPRVVFIAERLPESFLRKIRLLAFPAVNCFEYRCVEVNEATGFYLDPVDWAATEPARATPPATAAAAPADPVVFGRPAPLAASRPAAEPAQPSRWFGLLTPETQTPHGSPRQAESTAWAAASSAPVAETPAPAMPSREPVSQPAAPAADARLDDEHEQTPAWRKVLEKLAGTFDPRSADPVPAAAHERPVSPTPEPEKEPVGAHVGPFHNGGAGRHADAMRRALLDVVKLPPNGELVPQWRKFLEKTPLDDAKVGAFLEKPALDNVKVGAFLEKPALDNVRIGQFLEKPALDDVKIEKFAETAPLDDTKTGRFPEKPLLNDTEAKIASVREYLHHEFPMCTIYDFHDHQRNAQVVQLQDSQGKVSNLAVISVEFLDAHGESELRTVLDKLGLPYQMRQAGQAGVVVTPDGLQDQKR